MKTSGIPILLILIVYASAADKTSPSAESKTIRGWLSDESCANARASSGKFTGTNPDCAKECVAKGKKIVLIDPEAKQVVKIETQESARDYIGDYVEIKGALSSQTQMLHIDSLRKLSTGVTECERPTLKNQ
jgi:hypothetical protein